MFSPALFARLCVLTATPVPKFLSAEIWLAAGKDAFFAVQHRGVCLLKVPLGTTSLGCRSAV